MVGWGAEVEKAGEGVGAGGGAIGQRISGGLFELRGRCPATRQRIQEPVPGGIALPLGRGPQPSGR